MQIAMYEQKRIFLTEEFPKFTSREIAIDQIKKRGQKRAYTCPFCEEFLTLRAGSMNEPHFAHIRGKSCLMSQAYEQYEKQINRESSNHSVITDAIYDDLSTQGKYKPDLKVEHGFQAKLKENWKIVPDIVVKKGSQEFGISILTNVHQKGDENLVKLIRKRQKYFKEKELDVIWFVEDRELSVDLTYRVLFLWESEILITSKTPWDCKWENLVHELSINDTYPLHEVFNYHGRTELTNDVRSLYYVNSNQDEITFSVYRMILDELNSPYRAFAISTGYNIQLSEALVIEDQLRLANDDLEERHMALFRSDFANALHIMMQEYKETYVPNIIQKSASLSPQTRVAKQKTVRKIKEDLEVVHWDDGTVSYLINKLKRGYITEEDVIKLEYYLRHNRELVVFKGWELRDIQAMATSALGRIDDPKVRIHLVKIEEL
ncbi:competence protein CoiA [Paenibacillus polysaccharolyticus]|uniref:competence protein CoiA family protein n=1 Tax=Paenibacillus polysaccharolyticus TaxID=582692 RepID=UPI0020A12A32|nr:competence protein CoiA family protein [Paenibacillus polysaccharolyticus]MCP1133386.1 competence protein CoiA [Paenibacillus polysaccharolyticus]